MHMRAFSFSSLLPIVVAAAAAATTDVFLAVSGSPICICATHSADFFSLLQFVVRKMLL